MSSKRLSGETIHGVVKTLLMSGFDEPVPTPKCHTEWWDMCCSSAKFVAIAAPRGHAKSTAITHAYLICKVIFREASYVVLVSDTEAQSVLFLADIKKELSENEKLMALFGIEEIEKWPKDTETDIIIRFVDGHEARIVAKGSGQKIRGFKWGGKRPDLIICDDMENDELVMSKDRRDKLLKWFLNTLLPIRAKSGIIRIVGTILHEDSLLASLMPKETDKFCVTDGLVTYTTRESGWYSRLYRAHPSVTDFSKILWPERHSKEDLVAIRDMYIERGHPEGYAQEYLNQPLDETTAQFRRADFKEMTMEDREKTCHYYVGFDLAVTQETYSDYSAFVIGAVTESHDLLIKHVIYERMDSERAVETLFELQAMYEPEVFCFEKGQIASSVMPFLKRRQDETGIYLNLYATASRNDKTQRVQSFRARARAGKVKVDMEAPWAQTYIDQLCSFPRTRRDDLVDASAQLGLVLNRMVEAPTKEEIDEDEYEDLMRESGHTQQGRNKTTGY